MDRFLAHCSRGSSAAQAPREMGFKQGGGLAELR
jgi:hypothetical protein